MVRQADCIFVYSRIVVKANAVDVNEFELRIAAFSNRESDGVVSRGDTIFCHYVDSGRLVKTRTVHCDGLSQRISYRYHRWHLCSTPWETVGIGLSSRVLLIQRAIDIDSRQRRIVRQWEGIYSKLRDSRFGSRSEDDGIFNRCTYLGLNRDTRCTKTIWLCDVNLLVRTLVNGDVWNQVLIQRYDIVELFRAEVSQTVAV